jgi:hypothetical protein
MLEPAIKVQLFFLIQPRVVQKSLTRGWWNDIHLALFQSYASEIIEYFRLLRPRTPRGQRNGGAWVFRLFQNLYIYKSDPDKISGIQKKHEGRYR